MIIYTQGEGPAAPFLQQVVKGMDLSAGDVDDDDAAKAGLVRRFMAYMEEQAAAAVDGGCG